MSATEDIVIVLSSVPLTCFLMAEVSLPRCHGCVLVASRLNPGGICGGVEEPVGSLEPLPEYVHWDPRLSVLPELMKQLVRRDRQSDSKLESKSVGVMGIA